MARVNHHEEKVFSGFLLFFLAGNIIFWLGVGSFASLSWLTPFRFGATIPYCYPLGILIGAGVMLILAALSGFIVNDDRENAVVVFFCTLTAIFLQIGATTVIIASKSETQRNLKDDMENSMGYYWDEEHKFHNETVYSWNQLQKSYHCCGVQNFSDWMKLEQGKIPASCCIDQFRNTCLHQIKSNTSWSDIEKRVHPQGCFSAVVDHWYVQNLGFFSAITAIWLIVAVCYQCFTAFRKNAEYNLF